VTPFPAGSRVCDASFNGAILATGKANVEGTLDGKLTIASQATVVVQNDVWWESYRVMQFEQ